MIAQWLSDLVGKRVEVTSRRDGRETLMRGVVRAIGGGDSVFVVVELVAGTYSDGTAAPVGDEYASRVGALALFRWSWDPMITIRLVSDQEVERDHYLWRRE